MRKVALAVIVFVVTLLEVEGCSSISLTVYRTFVWSPQAVAERFYTRYDAELGWVAVPNASIPDLYGPGAGIHTNSYGFRGQEEITSTPPSDKLRVICSGDSFTLGFGVSDEDAWCARLSAIDSKLQTVNMGQGGYGLDQSYLWFLRDGAALSPGMHIFAFITADIDRMHSDSFLGYGKPVLALRNGHLATTNVPVPYPGMLSRWLYRMGPHLAEMRIVKLASAINRRIAPTSPAADSSTDASQRLLSAILRELYAINHEHGSILVLAYLPTEPDYYPNEATDTWRQIVERDAAAKGIIFVDLVSDFRESSGDTSDWFIPPGDIDLSHAAGHYTRVGNEHIARKLYDAMLTYPQIASRLARLD